MAALFSATLLHVAPPARGNTLSISGSVQEILQHGGEGAVTYYEWLESHEAEGRLGGIHDANSGDGVANLLKFLTGANPREPAGAVPRPRIDPLEDGRISLRYRLAQHTVGVRLALEVADESMNFSEVPFTKEVLNDGEHVQDVRLIEKTDTPTGARFARLRASLEAGPVPVSAHRTAAQLLEEQRFDPENVLWANQARISDVVVPFHRPDVDGVAYYEFEVLANNRPAGFILVGTGRHDHNIAHWMPHGRKLSDQLRELAGEEEPARFYRLDAGASVAENAEGEQVAYLGNPLPIIEPMLPEWADMEEDITATLTNNAPEHADDLEVGRYESELLFEGEDLDYRIDGWDTWPQLKEGYAETYDVLLGVLREDAAEEWDVERAITESGEGLVSRRSYPVAVLHELDSATLSEKSDRFVDMNVVDRSGNLPLIELQVLDQPSGSVFPFHITLEYANGLTETLDYFVFDPALLGGGKKTVQSPQQAEVLSTGSWSSWTTEWARHGVGAHDQQPRYGQYAYAGTECQLPPEFGGGTKLGPVGCGPVAWAMLFAWADNQAALGNPRWQGRWGIHLMDNLVAPAPDAVMPLKKTPVPPGDQHFVRYVIEDLHARMGTRCFQGGGLTFRGRMFDAIDYLRPRTLTKLSIEYNKFFVRRSKYREMVEDEIVNNNTPAVIGTGLVSAHYPVAYGFASRERIIQVPNIGITGIEYQRLFYANQGWYGSGNGWIPASVWFVGRIFP